jgi:predicted PurR-regulated permease PerM
VGSLLLITAIVWFAFRQVFTVFPELAGQVVIGVNEIRNWADGPPLNISNAQFDETWSQIQGQLTNSENWDFQNLVGGARGAASTVGSVVTGFILLVFCTIFFLLDGRTIWTWMVNLLPVTAREKVHQAARRGAVTLSAFVRTQILVAAVDGVGIGLGMLFFVPNFALPIGALVFIGSAIPILGAIITGTLASIIVLVARGWVSALIMLGIVLLVQQLESSILLPFLMGQAVSLHPVAVVLAVTGGSMVAGIAGALFAVPLVAVANTVVQYLFGVDKFPELGTRDHVPLLRRPKIEETFAVLQGSLRRVGRRLHDDEADETYESHFVLDEEPLDQDDDDVVAGAATVPEGEM